MGKHVLVTVAVTAGVIFLFSTLGFDHYLTGGRAFGTVKAS